ncbi:hypothetical protein SAMN06272775_1657 [Streptomyces sp. 2323.1]|nr:hypothetical protein SAMN06272775_1657 [Streptomyces sp. 2323.1]
MAPVPELTALSERLGLHGTGDITEFLEQALAGAIPTPSPVLLSEAAVSIELHDDAPS